MATLRAIRREMIARSAQLLGRVEAVGSLTTTTVVVPALAVGTFDSNRFANWWMVRAEAASTADRVRQVSAYASATGTLTHAGSNYSDTTATNEMVEVYRPEYEPRDLDRAIQITLSRLYREDRCVFPAIPGETRYWLDELPWVESPGDITRVMVARSALLSRNRSFEQWNSVTTAGGFLPDWWTLSGTSATVVRSATGSRRGAYSAAVTRDGNDAALTQAVGLLENGSTGGRLRGQTVSAVIVGTTATASQLRVTIDDGDTTTSSDYHSGGGALEELTVSHTVSVDATKLDVKVEVKADGTAYVDEAYLVIGEVTDSARLDRYDETELRRPDLRFDQGAGTLSMFVPSMGRGYQYVVYSKRPYPQFDATRLAAGTADADETDAPLATVATGALYRLHEGLGQTNDADRVRYLQIANEWRERYETLANAALYVPEDHDGGVPLPVGPVGGWSASGRF